MSTVSKKVVKWRTKSLLRIKFDFTSLCAFLAMSRSRRPKCLTRNNRSRHLCLTSPGLIRCFQTGYEPIVHGERVKAAGRGVVYAGFKKHLFVRVAQCIMHILAPLHQSIF